MSQKRTVPPHRATAPATHALNAMALVTVLFAAVPPVARAAEWHVTVNPAAIAPTPATVDDSGHVPEVTGQPRQAQGHPCTLWDQQDLERYRKMMSSNEEMKQLSTKLIADAE